MNTVDFICKLYILFFLAHCRRTRANLFKFHSRFIQVFQHFWIFDFTWKASHLEASGSSQVEELFKNWQSIRLINQLVHELFIEKQ